MSTLINKLRQFVSAIAEQILFSVVFIISLIAWIYFKSGFAVIATFTIGILLACLISSKISGKDNLDR